MMAVLADVAVALGLGQRQRRLTPLARLVVAVNEEQGIAEVLQAVGAAALVVHFLGQRQPLLDARHPFVEVAQQQQAVADVLQQDGPGEARVLGLGLAQAQGVPVFQPRS
jgi:hypothetical protein